MKITIAFLAALIASGCSSVVYKKDPEKTAQVKTVAIIAFSSIQPKISQEKLLGALLGADNGTSITAAWCDSAPHLNSIDKIVETEFQKTSGMKILPFEKFKSNAVYTELVNRSTKAAGHMIINKNQSCSRADGMIDYYKWTDISTQDIAKLKAALKVDAVMKVLVETLQESISIMGVAAGGEKTSVRINASLYNGVDEEPIYFDTNAHGEQVKEGTTSVFGFSSRDAITQKVIVGSESAAKLLSKRYQSGP